MTKHTALSRDDMVGDTFITFLLDPRPRLQAASLSDGVGKRFAQIANCDLHWPLLLLQRSMWQERIDIRLLHTIWAIEYLARQVPTNPEIVASRERVFNRLMELAKADSDPQIAQALAMARDRFMQVSFRQAVVNYSSRIGAALDAQGLSAALKARNSLSHGGATDVELLASGELWSRRFLRDALRLELKARNIDI